MSDHNGITGTLVLERRDTEGRLIERFEGRNLVTRYGDQMYGERGASIAGAPAAPTGMKLGTGGTAPAKTGAGAALTGYLSGSNKAFDATYPQSSLSGSSRRITYKRTYAAGEATTASPITEAVIVNDTITDDSTSVEGETISRIAVAGISAKGADDTLTATWYHDILGA